MVISYMVGCLGDPEYVEAMGISTLDLLSLRKCALCL